MESDSSPEFGDASGEIPGPDSRSVPGNKTDTHVFDESGTEGKNVPTKKKVRDPENNRAATHHAPISVSENDRHIPSDSERTDPEATHASVTDDLDSDDEYISSGDEALDALQNADSHHRHLTYGSGIAQHTAFFEKSLGDALDSVALDSSLALQAQLSGQLNDKSKLLCEKKSEILVRLDTLKGLYKQYIVDNQLGELEKDIDALSARIRHLKHGHSKTTLFRRKPSLGIADQYPIEYNQARDKVLERSTID